MLGALMVMTVAAQATTAWPGAKNVLVVVNTTSSDSLKLGRYYAAERGVPRENILLLTVPTDEEIPKADYESQIEAKVDATIKASKNRLDFVLLCKGIPIRVKETGYSVDSLLMARALPFVEVGDEKKKFRLAPNPFCNKAERFNSATFRINLVTRLDAYTYEEARNLVDLATKAKPAKGPFALDVAGNRNSGGYLDLNNALKKAAEGLRARSLEVELDETEVFALPSRSVMGYCSWGSNDGKYSSETYKKIRFLPGAVCETFVSTSARTFAPTTGGQSLIVDLIRQGVTGVKGYVSEPYTFALARPEILFDRYTKGFNLAESFYMASPVTKWKDLVIGDPICQPFKP